MFRELNRNALQDVLARLRRPTRDDLKTFPEDSRRHANFFPTWSINIGNFESAQKNHCVFRRDQHFLVGMQMQTAYELENALMVEAVAELKSAGKVSDCLKESLLKAFGERYTNGWQLANSRKVRRYEFKPSGRVVWAVQGRKGQYQVMPDIPFCYCDDYYFRVMDKKRGLCYHIIAQRIAEALNQFTKISKRDAQYSTVAYRWRAKEKASEPE